jgi:hypothetical protein
VQLQNKEDELKWTGGDKSGLIFVKNVYCALTNKIWHQSIGGWRRHLWTWNIAQKIRLFTWLTIENKILTWDILQRKDGKVQVFSNCVQVIQSQCCIFLSSVPSQNKSGIG